MNFPPAPTMLDAILMSHPVIRGIEPSELPAAGALAGRVFRDGPVFLKMFPSNPAKRAGALGEIFAAALKQIAARGKVFGAFENGLLVGVCALAQPGRCQPSTAEKLALGKVISGVTSMGTALAFQRWQATLARRDPEHRHWHLGPIAVEIGKQRRGIGAALMRETCRSIDTTREPAFLETDQRAAAPFFEKFRFKEFLQVTVHDAPHLFMLRSPA